MKLRIFASFSLCAAIGLLWIFSEAMPGAPTCGLRLGHLGIAARHGRILVTPDLHARGVDAEVESPPFAFSQVTVHPPDPKAALNEANAQSTNFLGVIINSVGSMPAMNLYTGATTLTPGSLFLGQLSPVKSKILVPGVTLHQQYTGSFTLSSAGRSEADLILWRRLDIHLALPLSLSAFSLLLALRREAARRRDNKLAAKLGMASPIVRIGPLSTVRPRGLFQKMLSSFGTLVVGLSFVLFIGLASAIVQSS